MLQTSSQCASTFCANAATITTATTHSPFLQLIPPTTLPVRVSGIVIKDADDDAAHTEIDREGWLWLAVELCSAAERRAQVVFGNDNIPAALLTLRADMDSGGYPSDATIIGTLTTRFPTLTRSLRTLTIAGNRCDESADIGAFAVLATHLLEFAYRESSLTAPLGLKGRCEYLRIVNIWGCRNLGSLEGLDNHPCLEEVDASYTPITSVKPLSTCPSLTNVDVSYSLVTSLQGLQDHPRLEEVLASATRITSLEPLRTCPALRRVVLFENRLLASLAGLEGHQRLANVNAASTAIASVEPLKTCPALSVLYISDCPQLPDNVQFPPSVAIIR